MMRTFTTKITGRTDSDIALVLEDIAKIICAGYTSSASEGRMFTITGEEEYSQSNEDGENDEEEGEDDIRIDINGILINHYMEHPEDLHFNLYNPDLSMQRMVDVLEDDIASREHWAEKGGIIESIGYSEELDISPCYILLTLQDRDKDAQEAWQKERDRRGNTYRDDDDWDDEEDGDTEMEERYENATFEDADASTYEHGTDLLDE